jgi:hypothetical protein
MLSLRARVAACTLELSLSCDTLIGSFSHFVTFMTAPMLPARAVADRCGFPVMARNDLWDDGCPVLCESLELLSSSGCVAHIWVLSPVHLTLDGCSKIVVAIAQQAS